jgi:hypothetical protein
MPKRNARSRSAVAGAQRAIAATHGDATDAQLSALCAEFREAARNWPTLHHCGLSAPLSATVSRRGVPQGEPAWNDRWITAAAGCAPDSLSGRDVSEFKFRDDLCRFWFDGRRWHGHWYFDREPSNEPDYWPLARAALALVRERFPWAEAAMMDRSYDEARWHEILYEVHQPKVIELNSALSAVWLPWSVFEASARAMEKLAAEAKRRPGGAGETIVSAFPLPRLDAAVAALKESELRLKAAKLEFEEANGQADELIVGEDCRSVRWRGRLFEFTANQAAVVGLLLKALRDGVPQLSDAHVMEQISMKGTRFDKLFRDSREGKMHPAWKVLIVAGKRRGTHRLAAEFPLLVDRDGRGKLHESAKSP